MAHFYYQKLYYCTVTRNENLNKVSLAGDGQDRWTEKGLQP